MDVAQKKQELLERLAEAPAGVVFARIDILNEVQLSDLLKAEFVPYLRGAANTSHSNTDSLHEVCTNLAKQRALLQGAAVGDVLSFDIDDGTSVTRAAGTAPHNATGSFSYPKFEDSDYSNKTSFGYIVLHSLSEDGGQVSLSSTSNANTSITNEDGVAVSYFTDFSKYFLTASRANGELVSIDENTAPYTTPTIAEPFVPANTINGETYSGTAKDPTANSDVRHDFFTVANTSGGNAGGDLDLAENKYEGNTFVTILLTNAAGNFLAEETITDFEGETATVKSYANTASVVLEVAGVKGTFTEGETLTDTSTTADIFSSLVSNTQVTLTLSGNTFDTAANTDLDLGFSVSNTFSLEASPVRIDDVVTITSPAHGVTAGERIILKGADDEFGEFNDTFVVKEATTNTITFSTSNSVSVTPTGNFSLTKHIIFGESSNASAFVNIRTVNASANIVFQSSNLSTGFAIGNTITGSTGGSGTVDRRTLGGTWYQTKTSEVKTYYTTSTSGTWNYDSSNNPLGIESSANVGPFWLNEFKPVKINQIVASSGTGDSYVAPKMVLDIALATSSDTSGGYNDSITTTLPGIYFAYPLKTYEAQVHGTTTTLEKYNNFANVVISPEGLDINYDWKPLGNSSGVATNGTHINTDGSVVTTSYNPEECTTLDKDEFNGHLGPYDDTATANSTYGYPNADDDIFLSAIPSNRSSGKKVGTSGAVYPSVNNNPFFPAVSGTHKPIANTSDGFTGTQPGGLTANDIFAGSYTQIDSGGIDPGTTAAPQDYRYRIWNDVKWTYGVNPHATGATKSGAYNVPRVTADSGGATGTFLDVYNGEFDTEMDAVQDESADGTSGSVVMVVPEGTVAVDASSTGYTNQPQQEYRCSSASGGLVQKRTRAVTRSGTVGNYNYTLEAWGNWAEFPCFFNRMQALISSAKTAVIGGTSGSYTVANMETNFGKLYQLLKNLDNSDYGKDFEDPLEPDTTGYATGQSDSSFETETEDLKSAMDALIGDHNTEHGRTYNHSFAYSSGTDNSLTHPADYRTTYHADFITEITSYRNVVKRRITEISNRIGYVNSRDVANGGTTSSPAKSVSGTGEGFQGYSFNSGNGYANTIYSHCNFLAGKKIKLLEKIMGAVEDVDSLYTNIKSKRSEYYEYNQ